MLSEAARWRLKGLSVGAIVVAFGAIDGVGGMHDFVYLLRGFSEQRPVITSSQYAGTMLLLAPMALSLGLIAMFLKKATPEGKKKAAENPSRREYFFLYFIAASIVAAFAAPFIQYIVVDHIATGRGYVSCPTPDWPRHQPDRWARSAAECPREGADPNR